MSTKNGKRKGAVKRKPATPAKNLYPEIPDLEAEFLKHGFWTVRVPPGAQKLLGSYILSGTMVLKNFGPAKIGINNGRPEGLELESGETLIIYVAQHVDVYTTGENSALMVFQYIPELK